MDFAFGWVDSGGFLTDIYPDIHFQLVVRFVVLVIFDFHKTCHPL